MSNTDLMKLKKAELISKINEIYKELTESNKKTYQRLRKIEELEVKLSNAEATEKEFRNRLEKVKQAIITAAAIHYPDVQIDYNGNGYDPYAPMIDSHSSDDEPEDLRLLRHLYGLSS